MDLKTNRFQKKNNDTKHDVLIFAPPIFGSPISGLKILSISLQMS